MRILVLGPMEIVSGAARTRPGPQQAALLAALLTDVGRAIPARRLIELLWDGDAPTGAAVTLRSHVSHLRRALAPESRTDAHRVLVSVGRGAGAGYLLDVEPENLDAGQFEALYFRAVRSMAAGDPYPCVDLLDTALALWRGAAFADVAERPFVVAEADRLNDLADSARRLRAEALANTGRGKEAIGDLRALLTRSPLDESLRTTLARTLYGLGRVDEAASLCREGIELLATRGLDAPEFASLQSQILRRELPPPGDPQRATGTARRDLPIPRQLPSDLPRFVGRDEPLERAAEQLTDQTSGSGVLVVSGQPGIGKTALAVRLAHRLDPHFPDGQLYIDLGGASAPRQEPMDVLAGFLRALGMPAAEVPDRQAERIQAYRSAVADRRVLVVLDNAYDETQVRPLLPSGDGCAAIVTSRARLSGLLGVRVTLDLLSPDAALRLFTDIVGEERVRREPEAAELIVRRCGLLPLAVWIAGTRLVTRPHWQLARTAADLSDESRRLDELAVSDVAVRAGLELTYQALDPESQLVFRRIGLLNTSDVSSWETAALLDTSVDRAERALDTLREVHLVNARVPGRYGVHDLVRLYARDLAVGDEQDSTADKAFGRVIGCARDLAFRAVHRFDTDRPDGPERGVPAWSLKPDEADVLVADPLAWFESEQNAVVRTVERAVRLGDVESAGVIANALAWYLRLTGQFDDWRQLHAGVLDLATRLGDRWTRVLVRRDLGDLETIQDNYSAALGHFVQALADTEELLADNAAPTDTLHAHHHALLSGLGYIHRLQGRYRTALAFFERAKRLTDGPDSTAVVFAMCGVGVVYLECGHHEAAEAVFTEALQVAREHGSMPGEAGVLLRLALAYQASGELDRAVSSLDRSRRVAAASGDRLAETHSAAWQADTWVRQGRIEPAVPVLERCLTTYRETGNVWGQATALGMLGSARLASGEPAAARSLVEGSVALWRRLGSPYWLARHLDLLADTHDRLGTPEAGPSRAEAARVRADLQAVSPPPIP